MPSEDEILAISVAIVHQDGASGSLADIPEEAARDDVLLAAARCRDASNHDGRFCQV